MHFANYAALAAVSVFFTTLIANICCKIENFSLLLRLRLFFICS